MIHKRSVKEKVRVDDFFENNNIPEKEDYFEKIPYSLKVKTPYGYYDVPEVCRTVKQQSIRIYFANNKTLECGWEHKLKVNGEWKEVQDIDIENDVIETDTGTTTIKRIHEGNEKILYDLSVEDVHCFYANGILSHNTWVLCQLGYNAAVHGSSILHITLELPKDYVLRRYDTILTGEPFTELRNSPEKLIKQLEQIKKMGGNVDVSEFPTRGITIKGLEGFLEKAVQIKKYDLILLDYADLLGRGANASGDDYSDMGGIYEELRGISSKLRIPIWTATQTNRSGLDKDVIGADSIADSYKKVMTADFIMSLTRKDIDKMNDKARAHIIKNRFGPDGMTFDCTMDTMIGKFHIYDAMVDNSEKQQQQNQLEKKQLQKKFNKLSGGKTFQPKNDFG